MNKVLKIITIVFWLIGLVFCGVGMFVNKEIKNFMDNGIKTNAIIKEISYDSVSDYHEVYVSYEVNGETYQEELNSYDTSMYEGQEIIIYYSKDNPHDIRTNNVQAITFIFSLIGSIFIIIAIIFCVILYINSQKRKKVIEQGFIVQANITGVNFNTMVTINGRNPYVLEASYLNPSDGKMYFFRSEDIMKDISLVLQQYNITTIPVYVDPNDYSKYYVDLSQITQYIGN